jgi:hypothetical protein
LSPLEPELLPLDIDASDATDPLDAPSPLVEPQGGKGWGLRHGFEGPELRLQPAATPTTPTAPVTQSLADCERQRRTACAARPESEDLMSEEAPLRQQAYDARADPAMLVGILEMHDCTRAIRCGLMASALSVGCSGKLVSLGRDPATTQPVDPAVVSHPVDGGAATGETGAGDAPTCVYDAPTLDEFPIPPAADGTTADPIGITAGPDGNVWFADRNGKIGRITPRGTIQEFPVPPGASGIIAEPTGIAAGPDGNIWFTEQNANKVGRITLPLVCASDAGTTD